MKKEYVKLNVQVVDVQLSDCIAGSHSSDDRQFVINGGSTLNQEIDGTVSGGIGFDKW